MYLDYVAKIEGAKLLVKTRSSNSHLQLVLEDDKNMPRTDGTKICMPLPHPTWTKEQWTEWYYILEHELGHNDPEMKKAMDLSQELKINMGSFFGTMLNFIDDTRQEHHNFDEYLGRKKSLEEGNYQWLNRHLPDIAPLFGKSGEKERDALETMLIWDMDVRSEFMKSLSDMSSTWESFLSPQQQEWLEKLRNSSYGEYLLSGISAEEQLQLTKDILDKIFQIDSEEEMQKAQQPSEGEGEEGEGEGEDEGKNEGEGENDEKGDKKKAAKAKIKYDDLLRHKHDKDSSGPTYQPLKIDYEGYNSVRAFEASDPSDYVLHDRSKENYSPTEYSRRVDRINVSKGLANKVRRLLQTKSVSYYRHSLKKGKISGKSIYRGCLENTGEAQQKIHKKKEINNILDTAASILIDGSGSMGGAKISHAIVSGMLLNEALGKIRIPFEITLFDESGRGPRHNVVKTFTSSATNEQIRDRLAYSCKHASMSNNSDGESILFAASRLIKQKSKRKILIVLSDGSPASWKGDAYSFTKEVIQQIEKDRFIEIYGIGIMDKNVERLYKNRQVIKSADQLEEALLTVIKDKIIN